MTSCMTWPASAVPSLTARHWLLPCLRRYLGLVAALREALSFCDNAWLCRSTGR